MTTYIVQKGDTLHRIARRFAVSVKNMIDANPRLQEGDRVTPGQVLSIPQLPPMYYVIQPMDTMYGIAERMNVGVQELAAANPAVNPQSLLIGQTLTIPQSRGFNIVSDAYEYGYVELMEDLAALRAMYPFIHMDSIGSSVLGKPIPALRIGTGPVEVHYNGGCHANEWITSQLLMKFTEDYARAVSTTGELRGVNVRKIFEEITLWIVPMLNPDGVELVHLGLDKEHPLYEDLYRMNGGSLSFHKWKANIRGVDLNDQFPAGWEEEQARHAVPGPGARDYGGTAPLQEPESRALAEFTKTHDFASVMSFHTQGREIYWNYRDYEPANSEQWAREIGLISGYKPVKLTGSDGGYKDWFIQEYGRPGFTIECGTGYNPLPLNQFREIYEDVAGLMLRGLEIR